MRRVFSLLFVGLATAAAHGQQLPNQQPTPAPATPPAVSAPDISSALPDSPGATLHPPPSEPQSVVAITEANYAVEGNRPAPCTTSGWRVVIRRTTIGNQPLHVDPTDKRPITTLCPNVLDPYARFLDTTMAIPMTPKQKGYLALHDFVDPFNLGTIAAASAFTIGIDSHTAYGPGVGGFADLVGVSLLQDATGEFFGTFLIPSIAHEDPHYHRLPRASIPRRIFHAVSRTVVAQHDDGTPTLNYSTLLTYPIASELANLYVPGIQSDSKSTALRIVTGYALDPVNNLVTEFLPDVAKRVHIRIIFVQQILNQVAATGPVNP